MGIWNSLFGRGRSTSTPPPARTTGDVAVGAKDDEIVTVTFNNKNITYNGELSGLDYTAILRDKQNYNNVQSLFSLSDYYTDAEPLIRGIIKEVYTPFSLSEDWKLIGGDSKKRKQLEEYYSKIHLYDFMANWFLQFFKYENVYTYLKEDGSLFTLPPHLIRISGIAVDGEPVLEYNCRSVRDDIYQMGVQAKKDFIDDEDQKVKFSSLPDEAIDGAVEGLEWVQLNPANTFVSQGLKEEWQRYAVPMIASCLSALAKKELISNYENALLNLGMRAFVHAKYGDPKNDILPDVASLNAVSGVFRRAMTGTALAVTNNWCDVEFIQPDTKDMFEYDKYKGVNADILSAGGISGIIVSGRSEDGSTFATAQVSMQTAAIRIKHARDNFCEMMNRVNQRLNRGGGGKTIPHASNEKIPVFTLPPVDLTGNKAFQEACLRLYKEGVLSKETLLTSYGHDFSLEVERRQEEIKNGIDEILSTPQATKQQPTEQTDETTRGRPTLEDGERASDPAKSQTGRQPKGSRPEGSEAQE